MKKSIFLLLLTPGLVLAQPAISIKPYINYGKTGVYNKEDTKGYTHGNGYVNPLPMVATFMPSYGMDVGFSWQRTKTGLQAIYTGVGNLPIVQNYAGHYSTATDNSVANARTTLNYINIPLHAKFRLGSAQKMVPFFTAGLNMLLLKSFTEDYKADVTFSGGTSVHITQTFIDNRLVIKDPIIFQAQYQRSVYEKMVLNSFLNVGVDYYFSPKLALSAAVFNMYSLSNPEYRGEISGNNSNSNFMSNKYFDTYITKIRSRGNADVRKESHIINTGLNISIIYKLTNNKNN